MAVPTGNFGNIFSAYIAKQMGLPIERLDWQQIKMIFYIDFLNIYIVVAKVCFTSSPAMDIQVASNFERYLFYVYRSR